MPSFHADAAADPLADKKQTKLSTSSPEALRVAAEITAHRLANLLIRKGPLAIRLITASLSSEVPGFDLLSLSKQRRLIMSAMEQGDPENNVVFEKIGWGQWAVRHVDSDYIVTEPNHPQSGLMNIHELREKAKLGWLKKSGLPERGLKNTPRRELISNNKANLHNVRVPGEAIEASGVFSNSDQDSDDALDDDDDSDVMKSDPIDPAAEVRALRMSFVNHGDFDDTAIAEDLDENADDDAAMFSFDDDDHPVQSIDKFKRSPPLQLANRVPTKFSPPPPLLGSRRKSSSATGLGSVTKASRHPLFSRSRLNSLENFDDYILSLAKNSALSITLPSYNALAQLTSPLGLWTGGDFVHDVSPENIALALQHAGRRKLSFNESSIRSTLSSSLPRGLAAHQRPFENGHSLNASVAGNIHVKKPTSLRHDMASDTDEEDWATMGAATLRSNSSGMSSPAPNKLQSEESTAARALVDLMST